MQQKTMGSFLAALRKASGMTQRELAEQLNVSDKTVRRWERDEGAPDLSLIPVIAELFGVTCDELLRGERRSPVERTQEDNDKKAQKQRKYLLASSLSRSRNRSLLSSALAVTGLIAAMICNFGFLRAYIGFFVGCVFYLAAGVSQAIILSNALFSVSEESLQDPDAAAFRRTVIRQAQRTFCLTAVLLGSSLPLLLLPGDAHVGLTAGGWCALGVLISVVIALICYIVCHFVDSKLMKNGTYVLTEKQQEIFKGNQRLLRTCVTALVICLAITGTAQLILNFAMDATSLAPSIRFDDYDSFIAFMERDVDSYSYGAPDNVVATPAPDSSIVYYDQYGNEITEEEANYRELTLPDGTVVCSYQARNRTVCNIRYSPKEDGSILPITVITYDALYAGQARLNAVNGVIAALYVLEIGLTVLVYALRRKNA
ncbi:MAG: helix-turn-helix domain-containing protein [Ruminococcaceae bacterium]|nr:helix-turn-helix domain-containing protein [Oscillospiraceae bacterium]